MGQDVQASMFNAVRVLVRTRKSRAARGGDTSVWMGWAGLFPVRIGWRWPFWLSAGSHTQSCTLFALCSPPSLQFGSYTFSPSTFCQALPHTHPSRERRRARKGPTQREPVCCCARNRLLFLCRPCPPVAVCPTPIPRRRVNHPHAHFKTPCSCVLDRSFIVSCRPPLAPPGSWLLRH